MAKVPNRSWATIDRHHWLSCGLSDDFSVNAISFAPCYEYNFKGFCGRINCGYSHACIKCNVQHTAFNCNLFNETKSNLGSEIKRPTFKLI